MTVLYLILLVLAAACFAGASFNKALGNVSLVALGLLFWVLVPLLETVQSLPD